MTKRIQLNFKVIRIIKDFPKNPNPPSLSSESSAAP